MFVNNLTVVKVVYTRKHRWVDTSGYREVQGDAGKYREVQGGAARYLKVPEREEMTVCDKIIIQHTTHTLTAFIIQPKE